MKKLIAVAVLLGTTLTGSNAHARCNRYDTTTCKPQDNSAEQWEGINRLVAALLDDDHPKPAPKRQPIYSTEQLNQLARAGLLTVAQIIWLTRYNRGEQNLGPFPLSRAAPAQSPLTSPDPTHCTTQWAPIGIGGQRQSTCQ